VVLGVSRRVTRPLRGGVIGLAIAAAICLGIYLFGLPAWWMGDVLMAISEPGGRLIAFVMGWPFQMEGALMATGLAVVPTLLLIGALFGVIVGVLTRK